MSTRKDHYQEAPANPFLAVSRLVRLVWALENAKPILADVLDAGANHPAFHNLLIELGNVDYLMRTLPIPRDASGRPLHPTDVKGGR